jgi:hypothetical protein
MVRRFVGFDSGGAFEPAPSRSTVDLTIEATDQAGQVPQWLDDDWWINALSRLDGCRVTLVVAPSPGALLHLVVSSQLEMLRRVAPSWRRVGFAYRGDVTSQAAVESLARSPYDEVRFYDRPRLSGRRLLDRGRPLPLAKLFGEVRAIQEAHDRVRPVLVRLPEDAPVDLTASRSK